MAQRIVLRQGGEPDICFPPVPLQRRVEGSCLTEGPIITDPHARAALPGHAQDDGHVGHQCGCALGGALGEKSSEGGESEGPVHGGPDGGLRGFVSLRVFVLPLRAGTRKGSHGKGLGQEGCKVNVLACPNVG